MEIKGLLTGIGRFLLKILISEIAVLIIVGVVCWLGGWHTLSAFGSGLTYAGIGAMLLGASSVIGSTRLAKDPAIRYVETVSQGDLDDRKNRHLLDLAESNAFLIL